MLEGREAISAAHQLHAGRRAGPAGRVDVENQCSEGPRRIRRFGRAHQHDIQRSGGVAHIEGLQAPVGFEVSTGVSSGQLVLADASADFSRRGFAINRELRASSERGSR